MNPTEITQVQAEADLIYSYEEVEAAIKKMSQEITAVLADKNPVILCLMIGGIIPTGKLLPLLNFPLQVEYVHVSRYRGGTRGGALHWIRKPTISLQDRHVLIVDDILDEGMTLMALVEECKNSDARPVPPMIAILLINLLPHKCLAHCVSIPCNPSHNQRHSDQER